jgi:hypothetical protein
MAAPTTSVRSGKSPSTITRQDVADLLTQIRELVDAFERRLKQLPTPAAPAATMRSQLPRRSFKSAPPRSASSKPRAFSTGRARSSTSQAGELHGPGCRCGMCPQEAR